MESAEGAARERTNLARVVASDDFDEKSGRVRDRESHLNVTFKSAVEQRLVDPDSLLHDLNSSKTVTLREALSMGIIDSNGQYVETSTGNKLGINQAVSSGHLALIASPMQAAQTVAEAVKRRDAEGYRFKLGPVEGDGGSKRASGGHGGAPRWREETVVTRRITPQRAEPGLSVRVRSSASDDPRSSHRARSLDDPLAVADAQNEFIEKLERIGFNVDERIIENPSTMRNVSVREAIESGLFDVSSGEIVHPASGRHYTVPKAIQVRLIAPDGGRRLMDALNIRPAEDPSGSGQHEQGSPGREEWGREVNWSGRPSELRDPSGHTVHRSTHYTSPDGQTTRTSEYTETRHDYDRI